MRLTQIKLAGFKSFAEPTTFQLPGQRVGVVGPNGCGKSNIIDAVRWVLGESKASELRGESMQDVGLAAAIGADHTHPLARQLEGGGFSEGLEARELDLVQAHAR